MVTKWGVSACLGLVIAASAGAAWQGAKTEEEIQREAKRRYAVLMKEALQKFQESLEEEQPKVDPFAVMDEIDKLHERRPEALQYKLIEWERGTMFKPVSGRFSGFTSSHVMVEQEDGQLTKIPLGVLDANRMTYVRRCVGELNEYVIELTAWTIERAVLERKLRGYPDGSLYGLEYLPSYAEVLKEVREEAEAVK